MTTENKHNLFYFERNSMRELYDCMEEWQLETGKRLLSTNIQKDGDLFCCVALSNPTEVIICKGSGADQADVIRGALEVTSY